MIQMVKVQHVVIVEETNRRVKGAAKNHTTNDGV